jgi:uncharacterized protein YeaO (DUF488 family)
LAVSVAIARVYEPRQPGQSQHRVLVDRLWPRGLSKEVADLDWWARHVAPSSELRRWYSHDPARFDEFAERYRAELAEAPAAGALVELSRLSSASRLLLLTATRDLEHSGAAVLKAALEPT